jgi:hypothetical protein
MGVYQQVLDMGPGSVEALETVLGCSLPEARAVYVGHGVYPLNTHSKTTKAPGAESDSMREA